MRIRIRIRNTSSYHTPEPLILLFILILSEKLHREFRMASLQESFLDYGKGFGTIRAKSALRCAV